MSITYNGTVVDDLDYNGTALEIVDYNTVRVYEKTAGNHLCFTANTAGSTVKVVKLGSPSLIPNFLYSYDKTNWNTMIIDSTVVALTNIGDKVYIRGNNPNGINNSNSDFHRFAMTGSISASGNVMSIIDNGSCSALTIPSSFCFFRLFAECSSLTTPPELPATTLSTKCYVLMFSSCSNLEFAPELPAMTMAEACYVSMFTECTKLTVAPVLPATTLAVRCYENMFYKCSLVLPPELPATKLETDCYQVMFNTCSSLIIADIVAPGFTKKWRVPTTDTFKNTLTLTNMFLGCAASTKRYSDNLNAVSGRYKEYYINNGPLCFTASTAGSSVGIHKVGTTTLGQNFLYSTDKIHWTECIPDTTVIALVNVGDKVYFKGNNPNGVSENWSKYYQFVMTGSIAASGNIMSLIDDGKCITTDIPNAQCYMWLFNGCTSLISTPELPATTLTDYCYWEIFNGCTALTSVSDLPAKTLAFGCYRGMFKGCSNLKTTPIISAEILANYCYCEMFSGCTSLQSVPELPVTTLAESCYSSMFEGCTSLVTTPNLPVETLAAGCYKMMFKGCTSLKTAGSINAKTAPASCCQEMFSGCTSLQIPPLNLYAETVHGYGYYRMFENCTSLVYVPNLYGTHSANSSYKEMFSGCTSLIVSDTPGDVYYRKWRIPTNGTFNEDITCTDMFKNCLVGSGRSTDNLEATTGSYKEYYTIGYSDKCLCFTANTAGSSISISKTGTPTKGLNFQYSTDTITWTECIPNTTVITLTNVGDKVYFKGNNPNGLGQYSPNAYYQFVMKGSIAASGNIMSLIDNGKCTTTTIPDNGCFYSLFENCTALTSAPELPATTLAESCYNSLFSSCTNLLVAPALPATTLATKCYNYMFYNCTSLIAPPELPARELLSYSYTSMFDGCTSLIVSDTPGLNYRKKWRIPASDSFSANSTQTDMFRYCLRGAGRSSNDLAAVSGSYKEYYINSGPLCFTANIAGSTISISRSLNKIIRDFKYSIDGKSWIEFLAEETTITLANIGDKVFFKGNNPNGISENITTCHRFVMTGSIAASGNVMSLIDDGKCITTTIPNNYCFINLFSGCTSLTTAPELPATTLTWGCYNFMFNGCTSLTTAPELPATTLAGNCYLYMFLGCTSLIMPPELPATTLTSECYSGMFYGCTALVVSDTKGIDCPKKWRIPSSNNFTHAGMYEMLNMFTNCLPGAGRSTNTLIAASGDHVEYYTNGYSDDCLCFTANTAGSSVGISKIGTPTKGLNFQYSTDTITWTECIPNTTVITLAKAGDKVYFKGNNPNGISENYSNMYYQFVMTGSIAASGDIMSLIDNGKCATTAIPNSLCFHKLFKGCSALTSAPELPAITLTESCYGSMFENCTTLKIAPELPATVMRRWCYEYMFKGCTNLSIAPALPAQSLSESCYYLMFYNCSSLIVSDKTGVGYDKKWRIPTSGNFSATITQTGMFYGCATGSGRSSNDLAATSGNYKEYYINSVPLNFTANTSESTISMTLVGTATLNLNFAYSYDLVNWFDFIPKTTTITLTNAGDKVYFKGNNPNGVSDLYATYTFAMTGSIAASGNIMSLIDNGAGNTLTIPNDYCFDKMFSGCPITSAPELPATTLAENCYLYMFGSCTLLTTAPALPATTLANSCYKGMFDRCTSLQVSDTQTTAAPYSWIIPSSGKFLNAINQGNMFYGCAGARSSDWLLPVSGQKKTYYTLNPPV